ncbi:MAG: hypothetical protein QMC85_06990 [Methanocellales archaeon]|nr:hypothetical protein [Methanocellales archaeon]
MMSVPQDLIDKIEDLRERALHLEELPKGFASDPIEQEYLEFENLAKLHPYMGKKLEEVYLLLVRAKFGKIHEFSAFHLLKSLLIVSTIASVIGCGIILLVGVSAGMPSQDQIALMSSFIIGVFSAVFCHEMAHVLIMVKSFGIIGTIHSSFMIGLVPRVSEEVKAHSCTRLAAYSSGPLANLALVLLALLSFKNVVAMVNLFVLVISIIPIGEGLVMTDGKQVLRGIACWK